MKYEYRCPECDYRVRWDECKNRHVAFCPEHEVQKFKRVFGFSHVKSMESHFNNTVGKPISSMRQFKSELARKSDEATLRTGIEHNYQPVEWGDKERLGVTGEGIYESNKRRAEIGAPLLPEIESV